MQQSQVITIVSPNVVREGDDVNKQDEQGYTALMATAKEGHGECVNILIKAGSDVNMQDENGNTALIFAAKGGHLSYINIMLTAGADVNEQDKDGSTALICATKQNYVKCFDVLLETGADVNTRDKYGNTAIMFAAENGYNVDKFITAGADVNTQNYIRRQTPLMLAAQKGHDKCVDTLIKAGADVNETDAGAFTALVHAANNGNDTCVEQLIEAGADVNWQDSWSHTALLYASVSHTNCVKHFLRSNVKINVFDQDGINALTFSLMLFQKDQIKEVIELLFAAGETIDETKVQVPDYLKPPEFNLKHVCREAIRKHLMNIDPHQHVFGRIPQLGLPSSVTKYLLYNVSLDDDDSDV